MPIKEYLISILSWCGILALAVICNFERVSKYPYFMQISMGFLIANVFVFLIYVLNNKTDWIFKAVSYKDNCFCKVFILAIVSIFIMIFVLCAFYIIDYEFINEGIKFLGLSYEFQKPAFLLKLSFICTSSCLTYCYASILKK